MPARTTVSRIRQRRLTSACRASVRFERELGSGFEALSRLDPNPVPRIESSERNGSWTFAWVFSVMTRLHIPGLHSQKPKDTVRCTLGTAGTKTETSSGRYKAKGNFRTAQHHS